MLVAPRLHDRHRNAAVAGLVSGSATLIVGFISGFGALTSVGRVLQEVAPAPVPTTTPGPAATTTVAAAPSGSAGNSAPSPPTPSQPQAEAAPAASGPIEGSPRPAVTPTT